MLLRSCNLAKCHESKTKRHRPKILCDSQQRARAKKAEAEKEKCVGHEFSGTTIGNPEKALEESHFSENGSRALQHTSNCI